MQDKIDQHTTEETTTTTVTPPKKTLTDVLFGGSTGKISRNLMGFLSEEDRDSLSKTCVNARRFDKVDRTMTDIDFKIKLMSEILAVLENPIYEEKLTVSRNPSGFLRLNNDLISLIEDKELLNAIPNAAELRLNFWPGALYKHLGARLEPETGHSHPRGFTSFIVTGGYKHDIHFPSTNPKDPGFMVYKGTVAKTGKTFEKLEGTHHLAHAIRETVSPESQYAYFSKEMIHQVHERIPAELESEDHGTLSINVVFDKLKSQEVAEYDLYMNNEGSLVERYDQLEPILAQNTLEIVRGLLKNKIIELTESKKEKALVTIESPTLEVRASSSPLTLFGGPKVQKDSFDSVVESVFDDEEDHVELPTLSKKEEPVKTNVLEEESTTQGIVVSLL